MGIAGPYPESEIGSRYLLVAMDSFTMLPGIYAIANQEASTVAGALVALWGPERAAQRPMAVT
jgi:hypothetical protein